MYAFKKKEHLSKGHWADIDKFAEQGKWNYNTSALRDNMPGKRKKGFKSSYRKGIVEFCINER